MSDELKHAGQMIREARQKAGLTQEELGKRLGISKAAVSKMESRENTPNLSTLKRVVEAMGLKLVVSIE